jgi:hypothetical protein
MPHISEFLQKIGSARSDYGELHAFFQCRRLCAAGCPSVLRGRFADLEGKGGTGAGTPGGHPLISRFSAAVFAALALPRGRKPSSSSPGDLSPGRALCLSAISVNLSRCD